MMDKRVLYILVVTCLLIVVFLAHNYVFSIYETRVMLDRDFLYADGSSTLTIKAVPVNGLGFRAPFRKGETSFAFEEGGDLVEVVKKDTANGLLSLKAKYTAGKVVVLVKPKYALLPTRIEIVIGRNYA